MPLSYNSRRVHELDCVSSTEAVLWHNLGILCIE